MTGLHTRFRPVLDRRRDAGMEEQGSLQGGCQKRVLLDRCSKNMGMEKVICGRHLNLPHAGRVRARATDQPRLIRIHENSRSVLQSG